MRKPSEKAYIPNPMCMPHGVKTPDTASSERVNIMRLREPYISPSGHIDDFPPCPSDSRELEGYGHLLASTFRDLSGIPQGDRRPPLDNAREWIKRVETTIGNCKGEEIQDLLEWYDIIHRQAYFRPAKFEFIYNNMRRALTDMARGEKADKTRFMRFIKNALPVHGSSIDIEVIGWYESTLDRWVRKYAYPTTIDPFSDDDTLRIVNHLLEEDLSAWTENQSALKRSLIERHIGAIDILNSEKPGSPTLSRIQIEAASWFAFLASQEITGIDHEEIRLHALRCLTLHPALDPFSRRAYHLDLQY